MLEAAATLKQYDTFVFTVGNEPFVSVLPPFP